MRAFFYDIVCPYAYMAFHYLHRHDVFNKNKIQLKPILLGGLFKLMEQPTDPNQYISPEKKRYLKTDIERQAQYFQVPLSFHERHPVPSLMAMRLIISAPLEKRELVTARLFKAYWQENVALDETQVLEKLAQEMGIMMPDERAKDLLIEATKEAFSWKAFGVPTFIIDEELFFGADRMALFADKLNLTLPDTEWTYSQKPFSFYFDFSSPYSFLAYQEIKKAKVNCTFIPVLLGAIFRERNINNVPMLAAHPHKLAYFHKDMHDWARARCSAFKFNDHFPVRSVNALRVALVEPKTKDAIFDAAWINNRDIGDEKTLVTVLQNAGFNGQELWNKSQTDAVKEQLKANTNSAIAQGVFGVPTFALDDHLIFGQDRFSVLRLALARA